MKDEIWYYPMFERPDGSIGIGTGTKYRDEAVAELVERDRELSIPDIRQWVKIIHIRYEKA